MCLAIPGKILEIQGNDPITMVGKVDFGGVIKEVSLAYVPEAKIGDYVNVHVGFALTVIDEEEAKEVIGYLNEIAKANEARLDEIRKRI
jgi:hydrogenase expression/formation protein HypC